MTDKIADELRALCMSDAERLSDHYRVNAFVRLGYTAADALEAKDRQIAELQAGGWQPIETAPKDGEAVLLYKPDERRVGEYIIAGYFGEWPGDGECWIACAGKPLGYFSEWQQAPQGYPTHWQPLPAPPSRLLNKEDRNG